MLLGAAPLSFDNGKSSAGAEGGKSLKGQDVETQLHGQSFSICVHIDTHPAKGLFSACVVRM